MITSNIYRSLILDINTLLTQSCQPLKAGTSAMIIPTIESYLSIVTGWQAAFDYKSIEKEFVFKNHYQLMAFLNAVAYLSHQQDHHPEVCYGYNHTKIRLTTHSAKGVTINDMIMAARISQLHIA
jgi:4a-hydroxytetrahydrobiopterin dehydratase